MTEYLSPSRPAGYGSCRYRSDRCPGRKVVTGTGARVRQRAYPHASNDHDPDGALHYPTTCEEGTRLWLTVRDEERIFKDLDRLLAGNTEVGEWTQAGGRVQADCAARRNSFSNRVLKEELVPAIAASVLQRRGAAALARHVRFWRVCAAGRRQHLPQLHHGHRSPLSQVDWATDHDGSSGSRPDA